MFVGISQIRCGLWCLFQLLTLTVTLLVCCTFYLQVCACYYNTDVDNFCYNDGAPTLHNYHFTSRSFLW